MVTDIVGLYCTGERCVTRQTRLRQVINTVVFEAAEMSGDEKEVENTGKRLKVVMLPRKKDL